MSSDGHVVEELGSDVVVESVLGEQLSERLQQVGRSRQRAPLELVSVGLECIRRLAGFPYCVLDSRVWPLTSKDTLLNVVVPAEFW